MYYWRTTRSYLEARHEVFGGPRAAPGRNPHRQIKRKPLGDVKNSFALACPVERWRRRHLSFTAAGLLDGHISETLCCAAADLGLNAAFAGREARTGFYAKFRLFRRRCNQAK